MQGETTTVWAIPNDARVICAGLACVDMQLNQATGGDGGEGIETFEGETSIGGGSVSMACKTMARLCSGGTLDGQVPNPLVSAVVPLCIIGADDTGNKLLRLLESCGTACDNVDTRVVRTVQEANADGNLRTALAVLPIYQDGRRGCFFDAASNKTFSSSQMIEMLQEVGVEGSSDSANGNPPVYGAMLFGYPHLLPMMQGEALCSIFTEARKYMKDGGLVALDLNGVPDTKTNRGVLRTVSDIWDDPVIGPALKHVDILHMNEDELELLTGCSISGAEEEVERGIANAVDLFLQCGVAVVAVTRGKKGSYVACNYGDRFDKTPALPKCWVNRSAHIPAALLPEGTKINTNGAGDSFTSGFLLASMLRHTGTTVPQAPSPKKPSPQKPGQSTKVTPYNMYMREKYVALKRRYNADKKAMFLKCNEMWENESAEVKAMYEWMAREENEKASNTTTASPSGESDGLASSQALGLESAVHFAALVAAHHVNVNTRDLKFVDVTKLLEQALMIPTGPQEI